MSYKRIESTGMPKEYTKEAFNNEPFVHISSSDSIQLDLQYFQLGMKNAIQECFVRLSVLERLYTASSLLPHGFKLVVFDAWRPFSLQEELYSVYSKTIVSHYGFENQSRDVQKKVIDKYVLPPIRSHKIPPVHTTGGAVDLSIMDDVGKMLDMGTSFDYFGVEAATDYFELHDISKTIRDNRRLLYYVMSSAGFTNLSSEWWHYDFGDRFWGYYTQHPAVYDGIFDLRGLYETTDRKE